MVVFLLDLPLKLKKRGSKKTTNPPVSLCFKERRRIPSHSVVFLVTNSLQLAVGANWLWDQGVYPHFCDTRESPPLYGVLVFGKPFSLYARSGHFPQPCRDPGCMILKERPKETIHFVGSRFLSKPRCILQI